MTNIDGFTEPGEQPDYFEEFLGELGDPAAIREMRALSVQRLELRPGSRVIDVGCGVGAATFPMASLVGPLGHTAGVDISCALIEAARRRATSGTAPEFQVADATDLPYPSEFFDASYCERVFMYLPDRLSVLRELRRVVRPGGRVCIVDSDFDTAAIYSTRRELTSKVESVMAAAVPNPNSGRELPALARESGLRNILVDTIAVTAPHRFLVLAGGGLMAEAVARGVLGKNELEEWFEEQRLLNERGDFFHAWLAVRITCTV